MRDGMRRSVGLALLLGILCAPPARAQDPAASRPWSDPPAKPAGPTEAEKPASSGDPATEAPRRTASTAPARKPAKTASRLRKAERPAVARRRDERRDRIATRPSRRTVTEAAPRQAPARRALAVR